MKGCHLPLLLLACVLAAWTPHFTTATLRISGALRSIGRKTMSIDSGSINVAQVGPQFGGYAVGTGLFAFRSGVISSLCQLDRGEKEAAMETLRVTIASLTMETTQTFGLPIMSTLIDKMVNKYGTRFSRTVRGFKSYNQMLGDSILMQANNVAAPGLLDQSSDIIDQLETMKSRMKIDFADEVTSFLDTTQAHNDLVTSLQNAKTWAKVAKWADFLLGPIFDAANIAFTGWQLHQAIQSGDQLGIASGSLGIVSSIVGIGAFVVSSLATTGSFLAVAAGPIGAIIGCVLTLASLIIDLINSYNPTQKITYHLELVKSLTESSKDMLAGAHKKMLQKATANGVTAGFNTLYEINQAMLVKASISDQWDTIKGFNNLEQNQLEFRPELVLQDGDDLVVGEMRVFDQKFYQNWAFKPEGREEIGHSYYGKDILNEEGGLSVRLNTDMVTNKESNMWFWLNGAKVTTFRPGEEENEADDNVNIGDFRTLWMSSGRMVEVDTGGGEDLVQITGVICAAEQQKRLYGKCLIARMGDGYDTISFAGMDTREEKLEWFLSNDDLSQKKMVVGITFDMIDNWLSYRIRGDEGTVSEVKFGGVDSVESFIGSPLNDVVKFEDDVEYHIKQSAGDNVYEFHISNEESRLIFIEDESDTPGHLIIRKDGLEWKNVVFCTKTNIILILLGGSSVAEVMLKRCKPGLEDFRVTVGNGSTKSVRDMTAFGSDTAVLLPYLPYPYRFNKNLAGTLAQDAYVELLLPRGDYPNRTMSYTFRFAHSFNKLILSEGLLNALRNKVYTLKAHRHGHAEGDGRWSLRLKRPTSSGGWNVHLAESASIVVGSPGVFQFICMLSREERDEFDIFEEYRTIMQEVVFDSSGSVYGRQEAEKLLFKFPVNLSKRDPPEEYVIDLKEPNQPTSTNRNELVIDDGLIIMYFKHQLRRYMIMELERASLNDDWLLKVYSNWERRKILRITVKLKNVHAIIAGPQHRWKILLNLQMSSEVHHNLNEIMTATVGQRYFD